MAKNVFKNLAAGIVVRRLRPCIKCGSNQGVGRDVEFLPGYYILHCACLKCGFNIVDTNAYNVRTDLKRVSRTWKRQCLKLWQNAN